MHFRPNHIYHVYNEGNNRQKIFHATSDFLVFLNHYQQMITPHAQTIAWCLMPDHFHFMLLAGKSGSEKLQQGGITIDKLTNGFRMLLSHYARIFNNEYGRSGSVFRQKTKAICLTDIVPATKKKSRPKELLSQCFHAIHQKPFVSQLVTRIEDWEFSSFPEYSMEKTGGICDKELARKFCGYQPADFIEKSYNLTETELIKYLK